jgi:hypothetical protein
VKGFERTLVAPEPASPGIMNVGMLDQSGKEVIDEKVGGLSPVLEVRKVVDAATRFHLSL